MNKTSCLAAFLCLSLLCGCGGKKEETSAGAESAQAEAVQKGPFSDNEWTYNKVEKLDGHDYQISISRHADKDLPLIKDELGQDYYDNRVELKILRDGSVFYSKVFTKDTFLDFLSEADRKGSQLQGLAFDKTTPGGLVFGAQIGQPGSDSGPAFVVEVSKEGVMSITKDYNQDTMGEEMGGD